MKRIIHRFFVGPSQIKSIADRLESIGFRVTCRGTEHVYVEQIDPILSEGSFRREVEWAMFPRQPEREMAKKVGTFMAYVFCKGERDDG
jgi:hypothetical protein